MSAPSRNVSYKKPEEPSFLKAFKAKVGYREPIGIEAKREREVPKPPQGDDEEVDRDDEQPTVVVLREGDLGQEEYALLRTQSKAKDGDDSDSDAGIPTVLPRPQTGGERDDKDKGGKIKFRKPVKRRSHDGSAVGGVLGASTSKKAKTDTPQKSGVATVVLGGVTRRRRSSSGSESKSKQVKNSSLLSFGEDEDDT